MRFIHKFYSVIRGGKTGRVQHAGLPNLHFLTSRVEVFNAWRPGQLFFSHFCKKIKWFFSYFLIFLVDLGRPTCQKRVNPSLIRASYIVRLTFLGRPGQVSSFFDWPWQVGPAYFVILPIINVWWNECDISTLDVIRIASVAHVNLLVLSIIINSIWVIQICFGSATI